MKKRLIILLIFSFIIIFLVFNYKYIFYNYYNFVWNKYYDNNSYTWSLLYHSKALNKKVTREIYHNIWNDYFKLWELSDEDESKLFNYKLSESLYMSSLEISKDEETEFNLELVRERIKNIEEKAKENSEETKNNEEKSEEDNEEENKEDSSTDIDENNNNEENNSENNSENNNSSEGNNSSDENSDALKQERSEMYKLSENDSLWEITKEEEKLLEEYSEFLDRQERANQKYFNKQDDLDTSNIDSFYRMFNSQFDSFFDQWWEKDW